MTRLPQAAAATVDQAKLVRYLLDPAHPQNGGKAAYFARFGFTLADWQLLQLALRNHAMDNDIAAESASPHGRKCVVHCHFVTPDGRNPCIRTVWMVQSTRPPRLVTAYP